jgi:hypothetical protein
MTSRVELIYLDDYADEKGTFPISVAFADELGLTNGVVSVNWRLTDKDGTVINSRSNVSITPAVPTKVILSGDDLVISDGFEGRAEERRFGVKVVYNSDIGNNLVQTAECIFYIKNSAALPFPA